MLGGVAKGGSLCGIGECRGGICLRCGWERGRGRGRRSRGARRRVFKVGGVVLGLCVAGRLSGWVCRCGVFHGDFVCVGVFGVVLVRVVVWVADAAEVGPHPAPRTLEPHLAPLHEVVHAAPSQEHDPRWGIAFILLEVQIQSQSHDSDEFEEVDVEVVRLGPVRLPEELRRGVPQLWDGAPRLGGRHGPGGEGGYFAEIRRQSRGEIEVGWRERRGGGF